MVGENKQNVFLIQKDASSIAEFEISEFEISRVDCTCTFLSRYIYNFYGTLDHEIIVGFLKTFSPNTMPMPCFLFTEDTKGFSDISMALLSFYFKSIPGQFSL